MSKSTVHRILEVDIALLPWKINVNQPITEKNIVKTFQFAYTMTSTCIVQRDEIPFKRIWFTDEAKFPIE